MVESRLRSDGKLLDPLLKPLFNKWRKMTKLRKDLGGKFIEYSMDKLIEDLKINHKDEYIIESLLVYEGIVYGSLVL